jgi:vitamin B12/bleomycin/antimicrobial peptide transport system ATP-binding/permease protein
MSEKIIHVDRERLIRIARPYWISKEGRRGYFLVGIIFFFLGLSKVADVGIAWIAGEFSTALQARDVDKYHSTLLLYVAAIICLVPVNITYQYIRSLLALEWRGWLTKHLVDRYFANRSYYKLSYDHDIDNPDERMSQDIETFCNMSVGLSMSLIDSIITVITFVGLLWIISASLTLVAACYSLLGCLLTYMIASRLVPLNFEHVKREADLRYSLADVRRDVESIAFFNGEERAVDHIDTLLSKAITNIRETILLNRNLSLFTSNFNWFVALIPTALIAPYYFTGSLEFGVIVRAQIAFGHVFSGLTIFVNQFNAVSAYMANIERVGSFIEKLDECQLEEVSEEGSVIEIVEGSPLELRNVTVFTPDRARELVHEVSLVLQPGQGLMIIGPSGSGKSSLLRAIAGLWTRGSGTIIRPELDQIIFLPQQPYVPVSTLQAAVCYPRSTNCATSSQLLAMLRMVNLGDLPLRAGGLNVEQNWRELLSLGEQQRLSFARLLLALPPVAILDEATSALDHDNEDILYTLLRSRRTSLISVGHRESLFQHHDFILEFKGNGKWKLYPSQKI